MSEEMKAHGNEGKVEGKRFDEWIIVKRRLHDGGKLPTIHEGEVWWCGVGENVGVEIDGKSERFSRPVLLRKFSRFGFLAVPLTSQLHEGSWYVQFEFQNKVQIATLVQARAISVSRLYSKIGQVPYSDWARVLNAYIALICGKPRLEVSKNIPQA